jgi:hypothetical protein
VVTDVMPGWSIRAVYGLLLLVFAALCSLFAILAPFPAGYDERAHYSYAVYLAEETELSRSFDDMFLVDPAAHSTWTNDRNYLNHPSFYYAALVLTAQMFDTADAISPFLLRLANVGLSVAALALALQIGLGADWPMPARLVFGVMLATTPMLPILGGIVSNDNLAWFGGALACLGAYGLLSDGLSRGRLAMLAAGVALAGLAKLPAAMLCGIFLTTVLAALAVRVGWRTLADRRVLLALAFCSLALLPYLWFWSEYGSPVPYTKGHAAILEQRMTEIPQWREQRHDLPGYAGHFVLSLLMFWPPTVPRTTIEIALLVVPLGCFVLAMLGVMMAWRPPRNRCRTPIESLLLCGMIAVAVVMTIHFGFTFVRHLETGWLKGVYPRYYFPLLPLLAAAVAIAVARVNSWTIASIAVISMLGYAGFTGWTVVSFLS